MSGKETTVLSFRDLAELCRKYELCCDRFDMDMVVLAEAAETADCLTHDGKCVALDGERSLICYDTGSDTSCMIRESENRLIACDEHGFFTLSVAEHNELPLASCSGRHNSYFMTRLVDMDSALREHRLSKI